MGKTIQADHTAKLRKGQHPSCICRIEYRGILNLVHNLYSPSQLSPKIKEFINQVPNVSPTAPLGPSVNICFFLFVVMCSSCNNGIVLQNFLWKNYKHGLKDPMKNSTKHLEIQHNDNLLPTLRNPRKMFSQMGEHDKHHQPKYKVNNMQPLKLQQHQPELVT